MKKYIIVFGLIILTILSVFIYILHSFTDTINEAWSPRTNNLKMYFTDVDETVYFKASQWGLLGQHQRISISNKPISNESLNIEGKIINLYSDEIYYKRIGRDTLIIYTSPGFLKEKQKILFSKIKLIFVEYDYWNIKEIENNFRKNTIHKFCIAK